jgi:bifunctional non-homologous end joining protein LigD
MTLDRYRSKRDLSKSPEPAGREEGAGGEPLRFVVHKHRASHLHYDLRLELSGVLKSWAVPKGPSLDPTDKKLAMMVEDHPLDYGSFEGVVPKGNYGAGVVMIWDRGTYHAAGPGKRGGDEESLRQGLEKGHLSFVLEGERLKGEFSLVRLRKAGENAWLLIKKRDAFAAEGGELSADTSVASGRTMDEIGEDAPDRENDIDLEDAPRTPLPGHVRPMLATLVREPFDRPGWLFEVKWDGYRALAEIRQGQIRLYSRHDKDLTARFPQVAEDLKSLPRDALLDGEIVVVDESGRAVFQLLQSYLQSGRGSLVYYVFDLLHYDGHDLRVLPLARRKSVLRQVLPSLPHVKLSGHVEEEGSGLFRAV